MQKFKFFTLAIITMLSVNVWGADYSIDFSTKGYSNQQVVSSATIATGLTVSFTKGSGSNDPKYYTTGTAVRVYAKGSFTISSTIGNITSVTFTFSSGEDSNTITPSTGTYTSTSKSWSGSAASITFSVGGSSGHRRIKEISVTVVSASPTITKTANLTDFTYEVGFGPSAAQSFTVGGSNLTANITVTAPTNFEVSKSSGSGYASSVTLTQSSGTVSNTTIYVRMKSGLPQGTGKGGDISLTSGATTQTIAVVGTVTAPSYTITAQSNNTSLGTVSGTTSITASPKTCVGYDNPAYTVAPAGKATVNQSGNTFTVSNVTDNVTVTINFAELDKDTYVDNLHGNADIERCGSYPAPSLDDAAKATEGNCDVVHYHFAGWVTDPIFTGTPGTPDDMITAGTNMTSNGRTYIAVWAKEE